MREVADNVFRVDGRLVNWYLVRDGRDFTLIDAGYPADSAAVLGSVEALGGRGEDVQAVLVTHAHADHLGGLAALQARFDTPALIGSSDLDAARSGRLEQVSLAAVLARSWRPRVARWAVAAVRRGGREVAPVRAEAMKVTKDEMRLDLPGRPVPLPTPGHTPGHFTVLLPEAGALMSGDALVTGHQVVRRTGPQLLPGFFAAEPTKISSGLAALIGLPVRLLLPGHGEPWSGSLDDAVEQALGESAEITQKRQVDRNRDSGGG